MGEPQTYTLSLAIGQHRLLRVRLDEPEPIAGWQVRFRLRQRGGPVLIERTLGSGVSVTDPDGGEWEIELASADTIGMSQQRYDWSFWRTNSGVETPIAYGTVAPYLTAETG